MTSNTVRLQILSDLHLGNTPFDRPETSADIVILAGDISRPMQAVNWAMGFKQPVLYVAGNHESYGSSVGRSTQELKERTAGTHIHFLNNDECVMRGVRFLGTTLWSDFNLFDDAQKREEAIAASVSFIRDFSVIESDSTPGQSFTPNDMDTLHATNRRWLSSKLAEPFNGPTVVISHHAPSTRSVHPRFSDSLVNACFVSNSEDLMGAEKVSLWIHGHTHDSFDYTVKGTRVLCNPRGYVRDGVLENPGFNPELIVGLNVPARS